MKKQTILFVLLLVVALSGSLFWGVSRVTAAATITVNSTADTTSDEGECTLREAIIASNTDTASGVTAGECTAGSGAGDTIEFDIAGAGVKTITLTSALPNITESATIDGYTQGTASANTVAASDDTQGLDGTLLVEINGADTYRAIRIDAGNSTIRGLVINSCTTGLEMYTNGGNSIEGNYIGTNTDGSAADANASNGIFIGSSNNTIGGTDAADRNLISGNAGRGISAGFGATTGNVIAGNLIGTDADGTSAIANGVGVYITTNPTNYTIGGTTTSARNVISGNDATGLYLIADTSGHTVSGNFIGTDVTGNAALGNGGEGLHIDNNVDSVTVGGDTAAERNVISGNGANGMRVQGTTSTDNVITGNYIGLGADGSTDLGNATNGIMFYASGSATVGGSTSALRNVISGNGSHGIEVANAATTSDLVIQGNSMGGNAAGNSAVPNAADGINLGNNASNVTIGGDASGEGNIISSNGNDGIALGSSSDVTVQGNYLGAAPGFDFDIGNTANGLYAIGTTNLTVGGTTTEERNIISGNDERGVLLSGVDNATVLGNYIGTDDDGDTDIGNTNDGVAVLDASTSVTIGGDASGEGNVISGNGDDGVNLSNNGVTVSGNYIGLNSDGDTALANGGRGIELSASDSNTIGGDTAGERNVIAASGAEGIGFFNGSDSNTVSGNYIGTDATGESDIGNTQDGIYLLSGNNNTIGGDASGEGNVISGNGDNGVEVSSTDVTGTVIAGNNIGTDDDGLQDLGNTAGGIDIDGSPSNTVGGDTAAERNVIAGNGTIGVLISGDAADSNTVSRNYIGVDTTGATALANGTYGVMVANSADSNTIGGDSEEYRNVISGNGGPGIQITDAGTSSNLIRANYIGVGASGDADAGNAGDGVSLVSSTGTTIGGTSEGQRNVISGNGGDGIQSSSSATVTVQGNYIGVAYDGVSEVENGAVGVNIGTTNNTIGGTASGARNVIAGNVQQGIALTADDNTVQGNYLGLGSNGTTVVMNGNTTQFANLAVYAANDNVIGGSTEAARNVLSGGSSAQINVIGSMGGSYTSGTIIQGNYLGTLADGSVTGSSGAVNAGVVILADVFDTTIGGTSAGEGNLITGNGAGVLIASLTPTLLTGQNSVVGNSIFNNSGGPVSEIGIDLAQTADFVTWVNTGVTVNDAGDVDEGTNYYQNFPEITSISTNGDDVTFTYNLDVNPSDSGVTGYRVDFYANMTADPSGYGQGQTYLGGDTGLSGDVTARSVTLSNTGLADGTYSFSAVTTATDASANGLASSSEFSAVLAATITGGGNNNGGGGGSDNGNSSVDLADTGRNILWLMTIAAALLVTGLGLTYWRTRKVNSSSLQ